MEHGRGERARVSWLPLLEQEVVRESKSLATVSGRDKVSAEDVEQLTLHEEMFDDY